MKTKFRLSKVCLFVLTIISAATAWGQSINVSGGLTAQDMANALLGSNVTITNAQFTGGSNAAGSFTQGSSGFPISDGILLTSGDINNALGPNTQPNATTANGLPGDPDLDGLIPGFTTFDATILEFDVTSNCNLLSIEYIFASEEYLEYGCSNYNDVFGFFISGPGFTGPTNIALVPGSTTPVSINNVIDHPTANCVSNPSFYVNNPTGSTGHEFDGRTVVLTAEAAIQPCQTYHIKIAVADAGDGILDSGIFLSGGGVNCSDNNLDVSASVNDFICGALGSIDITINNGTGPFTISWAGPNGFTANTEDISGLSPGDYTVTIDGADCLSSGEFTYTVQDVPDTIPPSITCPADITTVGSGGSCDAANVDLGQPVTSDNCSVASVSNDAPGVFPFGTTTVIWTAVDVAGNSSTCTQTVTVIDDITPIITCPQNVDVTVDAGTCSASNVALGTPTTSDNCTVASITNDAPATFPLGTTTVTWTVTDAAGNSAQCAQLVNVSDNENPTITCPSDVSVSADAGSCAAGSVQLGTPTTSDNCTVANVSNDAPAIFPLGTTTVTWTVTDGSGNTATCTQDVTVTDNENPTIACPSDVAVNTDAGSCTAGNVQLGTPTTSDNCSVANVSNDAPANFPIGTTTVTWTVTDGSGNTATCTQDVTVTDNENPTIACPSDVSVNVDAGTCSADSVQLGTPTTSDNCSVASVSNDAPATFPLGTTTVTWTVVDGSGNTATCTQDVTVTDNANPTITCPTDVSVSVDAGACTASNVQLGTPTTSDNCTVASVTNDAPATFPLGTTTVTWTVVDGAGNTVTCTQDVTVTDNENPTIACPSDVSVSADAGSCDAGNVALGTPTTSDNCTVASVTNDAPAIFPLGTTTVTWTVVDGSGNTATCTQDVTVTDNENPTIACPSDVSVNVDAGTCSADSVQLGTPTTSDNCSVASVSNDAPATFPLGTTTVTWTVVDGAGNTATCTQDVTVTDNANPTITCPADVSVSVDAGACTASNVALGTPTTSDNCTVASVTNDAPATFPLGTTTVTWTVVDGAGNTVTCTQDVTVTDNENPTIACPSDVSVSADAGSCDAGNVALGTPTTSDNCTVANVTNDAPAIFPLGTTVVTWTVTDGAGNTATCTQTVTVTDNENPTIACPSDVSVSADAGSCDAGNVVLGTPTTSDNCAVASVTNDAPATFPLGTTTVTWTVVDGSGNTATCTQDVTVTDNENPTIACPSDVAVGTDAGSCSADSVQLGTPVTSDNCSVASVSNDAPATFPLGTTTVTWTVTDGSGNIATCTQDVTVSDNEAPTAICQDLTIVLDELGNATIDVNDIDNGSYDNCGVASITIDVDTFDCSTIGVNTVTLTVTDNAGNVSTCTSTVTVSEGSFVELSCPGDQTYDCVQGCGYTGAWVSWDEPTASSFSSCDTGCDPNTQICGFIYLGEFQGNRYYCSNSSNYTWNQAEVAATTAGGHLVSINSAAENTFVRNSVMANYAWIGLTDEGVEGTFEWANGDAVNYTNWHPNEPNNQGPGGQCCGPADYTVLKTSNGKWYDRRACNKHEFVMEVPCGNPVTITQISGPQNGSYMGSNTSEIVTYVAIDEVTGATDTCSFQVTVSECVPVYCTSAGSCTAYEWIDHVDLGGISNASGNDGGYGDYTSMTTVAAPGDVINLNLIPGFSGQSWTETWRVFVDWNYDGDFYDQGELVFQDASSSAVSGSFTVPTNAYSGNLRVRVVMRWNCYAGPCSYFSYGEVEDYTLTVNNPLKSMIAAENGSGEEYNDVDERTGALEGFEFKSLYPDPVKASDGKVTLSYRLAEAGSVQVRIIDLSGKELFNDQLKSRKGENQSVLDVSMLKAGTYVVHFDNGDTHSSTKLIVH